MEGSEKKIILKRSDRVVKILTESIESDPQSMAEIARDIGINPVKSKNISIVTSNLVSYEILIGYLDYLRDNFLFKFNLLEKSRSRRFFIL